MSDPPKERLRLAQTTSVDMAAPWVGGVSSGVARYLGLSVVAVRFAFATLSAMGVGIILYTWMWLTLPKDGDPRLAESEGEGTTNTLRAPLRIVGPRRDRQRAAGGFFVAGTAFLFVGVVVAGIPLVTSSAGPIIACIFAILAGLTVTWIQAPRFTQKDRAGAVAMVAVGLALVALGTVGLAALNGLLTQLGSGLLLALAIMLGVAVALAPLGYRLFKDLATSTVNEARESERAEIAAHLHDSVLQTLTLIRGAADDPARVRSLALTQEGELRAWLYTGVTEPGESVAQALREQASAVETRYGIAVEVVTVGDGVPESADLAAVAAAAEAITNAARHGAPPITVFQELRPRVIEISIKDSGRGFDPREVPVDRHGLRYSIRGRVERVGGTVVVRSSGIQADDPEGVTGSRGSFEGTEVRISVPRQGSTFTAPENESDPHTNQAAEPILEES